MDIKAVLEHHRHRLDYAQHLREVLQMLDPKLPEPIEVGLAHARWVFPHLKDEVLSLEAAAQLAPEFPLERLNSEFLDAPRCVPLGHISFSIYGPNYPSRTGTRPAVITFAGFDGAARRLTQARTLLVSDRDAVRRAAEDFSARVIDLHARVSAAYGRVTRALADKQAAAK